MRPEQHGREHGHAKRKCDDHDVEAGLVEQRHADRGIERRNRGGGPIGENQTCDAAGDAEHEALDQQSAKQAESARADGNAHGQLAAAADAANQHQAGDVDADDQQDEAHRAQQHEHRLSDAADQRFAQRMDRHRVVAVGARIRLCQPAADGPHFGACRVDRHAGFQAPQHFDIVRATLRLEIPRREPQRDPQFGSQREYDARRHHADHLTRNAVRVNGLADDPRIRSESARPDGVAKHDHVPCAHRIVLAW